MPKFISTPPIGLTYTFAHRCRLAGVTTPCIPPIPVLIKAYPAFARAPMVTTLVDNVANVEEDLKNKQSASF